jgi:tetratricopeptide (TPR) repeat protein
MSATDLQAVIERFKAGTSTDADVAALRGALLKGALTVAQGDRAVAAGGDITDTIIITGDHNIVLKNNDVTTAQILAILFPPGPHQLPSDIADFTGRKREEKDLLNALKQGNGRVVISAINGMGGIGKTTLAIHVAHQLTERYPDAQIVVDMQGTTQPLAPVEAMLRVIRAFHPEISATDDINQVAPVYRDTLAGKRVLILLDNAANAVQVRLLAPPAPCALMVTSRRRIVLEGAQRFDLDALSEKDARDLLREILDNRRATKEQLSRIAELCGRLPLALRVVATFLAVHSDWTIDEYLEALSDERRRLAHLKHDDLDVEAALRLSAKQLEKEDAALVLRWQQFAAFPDSFNRAAAAAVWNVAIEEARDGLSKLFERGLVLYNEETARYRLHDLVRLFVATQLDDATRSAAQLHHAAHYCDELEKANDLYLQGGDAVKKGLALFDLEWRNIEAGQTRTAALAAENSQVTELCNRFPLAGIDILSLRQHPRKRIDWIESGLIAARQLKKRAYEGAYLCCLGLAYADLGEARRAIEFYEQYLAIARGMGDRHGEGTALGNLGLAYAALGETRRAIESYEQRLVIAREIGDRRGEGNATGNLGLAYADLGETQRAIEFYEQHRTIAREIGDRRGEGSATGNLGLAYADLGETRRAIEFYEQALVIDREIGDRRGEGNALGNLGLAYAALGETQRAIEFYEQALVIDREIGDRRGEGTDLGNLGLAYADLGETRRAIEFYEQRLIIAREVGDRRGEGNGLFCMSLALDALGEREQAIPLAEAALKIYEQIESPYAERARNVLAEWREQSPETSEA